MGRRKSVRFSPVTSNSPADSGVGGDRGTPSPVAPSNAKSILRHSANSPPTSGVGGDVTFESDVCSVDTGLGDTPPPEGDQVVQDTFSQEEQDTETEKGQVEQQEKDQERVENRSASTETSARVTPRARSAPSIGYKPPTREKPLFWDSEKRQFFSVEKDKADTENPTQVKVFQLNCPVTLGGPKLCYRSNKRETQTRPQTAIGGESLSSFHPAPPSECNDLSSVVRSTPCSSEPWAGISAPRPTVPLHFSVPNSAAFHPQTHPTYSLSTVPNFTSLTWKPDAKPHDESSSIYSSSHNNSNQNQSDPANLQITNSSQLHTNFPPGAPQRAARSSQQDYHREEGAPPPTHANTMSGIVTSPGIVSRTDAKLELQYLSTRLGSYIQYVREISENANQVDLAEFVDTIKILETELVNMKNIYEKELGSLRHEADELSRHKNLYHQEANKTKSLVSELENRLAVECDKSRQTAEDVTTLQRTLMQKEKEVQEARLAIHKPLTDLDKLARDYQGMLRDNEDLKRRYDKEQLQRQEAEDKSHQLAQKVEFDGELHEQQTHDLSDRLQGASATILSLEAKIREMTHADTALADMLQRVRSVAEEEIDRYRQESEARFNQNIAEMQSQLNAANQKVDDLTERNHHQHAELGELLARGRTLEGQVNSLEHQKVCLEELLNSERQRAHDNMRNMEHKLVELQDMLITKMREINTARDAQIPLKAEIETLRVMMQEEENRLKIPTSPHYDVPAPGLPPISGGPPSTFLPPSRPRAAFTASSQGAPIPTPPATAPTTGYGSAYSDTSARPMGPVRVRSAPAASRQRINMVPTTLGQGRDYFDEMFRDLNLQNPTPDGGRLTSDGMGVSECDGELERPTSAMTHDYTKRSSSATGDLKILEVQSEGKYIRIVNIAPQKEEEIGGYLIQQNVGGHPVAMFQFPPRVRLAANAMVTVWAGCNDPQLHQPPTDFYHRDQERWGTGPECTTILCRANGQTFQAVAWTTAAHRFTPDAGTSSPTNQDQLQAQPREAEMTPQDEELAEYNMNVNAQQSDPIYLRRQKEQPPSLNAPKHPHGNTPPTPTHPHTGQARCLTYGNDNSSVNRQTRGHSIRPDPVPGAPYAGAAGQRMGSALLRKYQPPNTTIKSNGALANKSDRHHGTVTSRPASAFQTPHDRFNTGLQQVMSQHNADFNPPMPRPPLFSTW